MPVTDASPLTAMARLLTRRQDKRGCRLLPLSLILVMGMFAWEPLQGGDDASDAALRRDVAAYVAENYQTPENYIIAKFKEHDIVFLGEMHGVKQNLQLLHRLIPELYSAGVYTLCYEFTHHRDQEKVDRLISADQYDPKLAEELLWGIDLTYVTYEYRDVYKVVWELNHRLPRGARPFRVLALNEDDELWRTHGELKPYIQSENLYWAQLISKEIIAHHEKALVYSGSGHSFTRFFFQRGEDSSFAAGNLIYNYIKDRTMTIRLHGNTEPVGLNESVERAMRDVPEERRRVGLDTVSWPVGRIPVAINGYLFRTQRCNSFSLADISDGYVMLAARTAFEPVTFVRGFVTRENYDRVEKQWRREHPRDQLYTIKELEDFAADNWRHLNDRK
jgi:hypothetical protein